MMVLAHARVIARSALHKDHRIIRLPFMFINFSVASWVHRTVKNLDAIPSCNYVYSNALSCLRGSESLFVSMCAFGAAGTGYLEMGCALCCVAVILMAVLVSGCVLILVSVWAVDLPKGWTQEWDERPWASVLGKNRSMPKPLNCAFPRNPRAMGALLFLCQAVHLWES